MYSAEIGRWMAADPWEEDVSSYIYVGNDPVNFFDPNGKGRFGKWLKEKADDIGDAAKQFGNWVANDALPELDPTYIRAPELDDGPGKAIFKMWRTMVTTPYWLIPEISKASGASGNSSNYDSDFDASGYYAWNFYSNDCNFDIDAHTLIAGPGIFEFPPEAYDDPILAIEIQYRYLVGSGQYSQAVQHLITSFNLDKEIKQYAYGITITESEEKYGTTKIGAGEFEIELTTGLLKHDHFGTIVRSVLHEIAHCWQLGRGISDSNEREFLSRYTSIFSGGTGDFILPQAEEAYIQLWIEEAKKYYQKFNKTKKEKYKDLYQKFLNY